MTNLYVETSDVYLEQPLEIDGIGENEITTAFESMSIVYHGLLTTKPADFKQPRIHQSLVRRLNEISTVTGLSVESITLGVDEIVSGNYSEENAFLEGLRVIYEKILKWLSEVRAWLSNILKKVFSSQTAQKATNAANTQTFKSAKRKADSQQSTTQAPFPTKVECSLPGVCLLLFHTTKFDPDPKRVYNTASIKLAIEKVDKQITYFLDRYTPASETALRGVSDLISEISASYHRAPYKTFMQANKTKLLEDMYTNKFECIGFGITEKPLRNQSNLIQNKFTLTNIVPDKGWQGVEGVKLVFEVSEYETLNDLIAKTTDKTLGRIIQLFAKFTDSKPLKELESLKSTLTKEVSVFSNTNENMTSDMAHKREQLERVTVIYELVSQMSDNVSKLVQFYIRYTTMLNRLMGLVAQQLNQATDASA